MNKFGKISCVYPYIFKRDIRMGLRGTVNKISTIN